MPFGPAFHPNKKSVAKVNSSLSLIAIFCVGLGRGDIHHTMCAASWPLNPEFWIQKILERYLSTRTELILANAPYAVNINPNVA